MQAEQRTVGDEAMRILVIDDDPITLDILCALLSEAGYLVGVHDSPFGSAQILRRDHPDVVLVDVEMPALKGDTIIANLRRNLDPTGDVAGTEFILYSGKRASELETLARQSGALGWIEKDGDFDAFLARLQTLISESPTLSAKLDQMRASL